VQLKNNIIFVGDSFCDCFATVGNGSDNSRVRDCEKTDQGIDSILHPTVVAKHWGYNLYNFGYGGKSWWYSRYQLYDFLTDGCSNSVQLDNVAAMVFFHTDPGRLNTHDDNKSSEFNYAHKLWQTVLVDMNFHNWAQKSWFLEIKELFKNVPTLHFNCFPFTVENSHVLPGMIFDTPLVHLSLGELTGSDKELERQISTNETRWNHFNNQNNKALADVIINALDNYRPGIYNIDTSDFYQPNRNAHLWPNPGYGTK